MYIYIYILYFFLLLWSRWRNQEQKGNLSWAWSSQRPHRSRSLLLFTYKESLMYGSWIVFTWLYFATLWLQKMFCRIIHRRCRSISVYFCWTWMRRTDQSSKICSLMLEWFVINCGFDRCSKIQSCVIIVSMRFCGQFYSVVVSTPALQAKSWEVQNWTHLIFVIKQNGSSGGLVSTETLVSGIQLSKTQHMGSLEQIDWDLDASG